MAKVKILKGVAAAPWNLGAFVGDVIECDDALAAKMVKAGRAEYAGPVTETAESKAETATAKPQRKR